MLKKFEPRFVKNYCKNLLSWEDIERIINTRPLITNERFSSFCGKQYNWNNDVWTTEPNSFPPSVTKQCINNGVSVIVDSSRFDRRLNDFCKNLEETYGRPTDSHIYMCKNIHEEHPFGIHFDYNHNVIVQCEGQSHFNVWNEVIDKEQNNTKMNIIDKPILDVIMSPGDAIWIPAFYPHLVSSKTNRMSVSFPIVAKYNTNGYVFQEREWIKL